MTDPAPLPDNGLSLSGWGATLRAQGRDVIVVALLAAMTTFAWGGFRDLNMLLIDSRTQQVREHQALLDAQDNLACVLLMSAEARARFTGDPRKVCDYLQVIRGTLR